MGDKIRKSHVILDRLNVQKNNLLDLQKLLAKYSLEIGTVVDEAKYIPIEVVKAEWIPKKEVEELLKIREAYEECRNQLNQIDEATKDVEFKIKPLVTKIKDKVK